MKIKISLPLSMLILGSLSVSLSREQHSDELVRESVFVVTYKNNAEFGDCDGTCNLDYRCDATLSNETEYLYVTSTRYEKVKLYDIHVAWNWPCLNQLHCIVELQTSEDRKINTSLRTFQNDFGTPTEAMAMFRGMQVSDQFNVSMRAWSLLLEDPDNHTPKFSTISNETVDRLESDTIISPVAMACMSLLLATGVCSYLAHISV